MTILSIGFVCMLVGFAVGWMVCLLMTLVGRSGDDDPSLADPALYGSDSRWASKPAPKDG